MKAPKRLSSQLSERRLTVAIRDYEKHTGPVQTAELLRTFANRIEQGLSMSEIEKPNT